MRHGHAVIYTQVSDSERGWRTGSPLWSTPHMAESRHNAGASKIFGSSVMSVTSTPGRCSVRRCRIWPSGRTVKLAHLEGRVVLLFALNQKWFSAARHF